MDLIRKTAFRPYWHTLLSAGCCIRCAFRMMNVLDTTLYMQSDSELTALMESELGIKVEAQTFTECTACVGALTDAVKRIPIVIDQIREADYQFNDYTLSISVPSLFLIRHHALWYHVYNTLIAPADSSATAAASSNAAPPSSQGSSDSSSSSSSAHPPTTERPETWRMSQPNEEVLCMKETLKKLFRPSIDKSFDASLFVGRECDFIITVTYEMTKTLTDNDRNGKFAQLMMKVHDGVGKKSGRKRRNNGELVGEGGSMKPRNNQKKYGTNPLATSNVQEDIHHLTCGDWLESGVCPPLPPVLDDTITTHRRPRKRRVRKFNNNFATLDKKEQKERLTQTPTAEATTQGGGEGDNKNDNSSDDVVMVEAKTGDSNSAQTTQDISQSTSSSSSSTATPMDTTATTAITTTTTPPADTADSSASSSLSPPIPESPYFTAVTTCSHKSLMLIGRYSKYSRECSQTAFFIGGVRKGDASVEEYILPPILKHYKSTEAKFSSSGREDLDVRMLGGGRPFIIEIMEPKRIVVDQPTISAMQEAINASTHRVNITDLHLCSKQECKELRRNVTLKKKHYRCVVWAKDAITPEKLGLLSSKIDLQVAQSTPVRVMHRRALLVRDKVIHSMKCEYINPHFFVLDLVTSSGTYIKEFVHGDRGRTVPNVCQILGCDADILQLDVVDLL